MNDSVSHNSNTSKQQPAPFACHGMARAPPCLMVSQTVHGYRMCIITRHTMSHLCICNGPPLWVLWNRKCFLRYETCESDAQLPTHSLARAGAHVLGACSHRVTAAGSMQQNQSQRCRQPQYMHVVCIDRWPVRAQHSTCHATSQARGTSAYSIATGTARNRL